MMSCNSESRDLGIRHLLLDKIRSGTGGWTIFYVTVSIQLVLFHKTVIVTGLDRLLLKTGRSNGKNEQVLQESREIGTFLFRSSHLLWNKTGKNVFAHLKQDETSKNIQSNGQTMFDRQCLLISRRIPLMFLNFNRDTTLLAPSECAKIYHWLPKGKYHWSLTDLNSVALLTLVR